MTDPRDTVSVTFHFFKPTAETHALLSLTLVFDPREGPARDRVSVYVRQHTLCNDRTAGMDSYAPAYRFEKLAGKKTIVALEDAGLLTAEMVNFYMAGTPLLMELLLELTLNDLVRMRIFVDGKLLDA